MTLCLCGLMECSAVQKESSTRAAQQFDRQMRREYGKRRNFAMEKREKVNVTEDESDRTEKRKQFEGCNVHQSLVNSDNFGMESNI